VLDIGLEHLAQAFRVVVGKIDVVVDTVQAEPDRLLGRLAVEVVQ
jgi:hypothetical protein